MPVTLTVNNIPFEYPIPGDSPGWGGPATDWAVEVTNVLNDLLGPDDLTQTTASIGNNVAVLTNITGLFFNTGTVRSATIDYNIYRVTATNTFGQAEAGNIRIVYDNNAPVNQKWSLGVFDQVGNAGVIFSITDAGQLQYTSTNLSGSGYIGVMHFRAKSLAQ